MAQKSSPPPACDSNGIFHLHCLTCGHPVDIWPDADDTEEFDFHCLKCGAGHEFSETLVVSSQPRTPEEQARFRKEHARLCLEANLAAPAAEHPSSTEDEAA